MKRRFRVTEIVQQAYEYEVEADSVKQAEDNVRRGIFNNTKESQVIRTKQLDATYEAKEIW